MDRTSITPHWPGRPATGGRLPSALGRHPVSDCIEIFKKTPFVSGLHPVSRDVVKDHTDIASIPLLTKTLTETMRDHLRPAASGEGQMGVENPTAVTQASHQNVLRSADLCAAIAGAAVGSKGILNHADKVLAPAGISNRTLTDRGLDARRPWTLPGQFECAIAGARSLRAGDLENHSYADI